MCPYKGSGAAAADLLTGRIVMMISDLLPVVEHIKTGELIVLAMADQKGSPLFPDVPAIAETVPGFNVLSWTGLIAPAGTPPDVVNRLATPMLANVRSPDYAKDIVKFGMEPLPMTPDEFTAFLAEDVPRWAAVVKRTGAHVD
jgi:tripartite-type tricarboxylate transporter receptor subunit TctC